MCQQLTDIRTALSTYARDFVAASLRRDQPEQVLEDAAAIEAMAAAIKSLTAAFLADVGFWAGSGRSEAEGLARATGTSIGAARDAIDTGRRLGSQPAVGAAARAGRLSAAQASMIANAAAANPTAAPRLLQSAARGSLVELREECALVKAKAADAEERHRAIHAGRELRAWTDVEGVGQLRASGPSEGIAQVMAALGPLADGFFEEARAQGRREPPAAYGFDALVELASAATSAEATPKSGRGRKGAAVKLLVRVDYDAFLRGVAAEGETCELAGYGPVPLSVVHELMERGDPFVSAILTRAKAVVGVAHLGRKPTAYQRSALEWLYPTCAAEGCTNSVRLECDHRVDWAKTHITVLEWLDLLCPREHRLKTREGWSLVEGVGKRPFVPPDDPRHPRHKRREGAA